MAESKLRDLSMDFSVKVIKLCDNMKGHHSLVNQLERSATSIGANIHEANLSIHNVKIIEYTCKLGWRLYAVSRLKY